jgi:hypothetical protein
VGAFGIRIGSEIGSEGVPGVLPVFTGSTGRAELVLFEPEVKYHTKLPTPTNNPTATTANFTVLPEPPSAIALLLPVVSRVQRTCSG